MNNRPIDRSKKSNIKCEHCAYCDKPAEFWKIIIVGSTLRKLTIGTDAKISSGQRKAVSDDENDI